MVCSQCHTESPAGKKYCGDCGHAFQLTSTTLPALDVEKEVQRILQEKFKDPKVLDVETSEAIAKRLQGWATLFVFFLGIPVALATILIGKGYYDLSTVIQNTKDLVDIKTKAAITQIKTAEDYARSTIETSKAVQKDLDDARHVVTEVRTLRSDVNSLQSQVEGFYKTQIRELFGGHQNEGRYSGATGKWVVSLKKQPIPASLRVRCGAIELYPETYQLVGSKLTVNCGLDLKPAPKEDEQDFIEVLYHSRN